MIVVKVDFHIVSLGLHRIDFASALNKRMRWSCKYINIPLPRLAEETFYGERVLEKLFF